MNSINAIRLIVEADRSSITSSFSLTHFQVAVEVVWTSSLQVFVYFTWLILMCE